MASTRAKPSGNCGFQRSISPNARFVSTSSHSASPSSFCSTSAAFSLSSSGFFTGSASLTRTHPYGSGRSAPSVRFSLDRWRSPSRTLAGTSISSMRDRVIKKRSGVTSPVPKKECMCSPTTHPGSFRCSLHKNVGPPVPKKECMCSPTTHPGSFRCSLRKNVGPPNRLDTRRSSMTNSLVRIGSVEGEWVRRALVNLIRPTSHQQRRRAAFQPRPSRLSIMSKEEDNEVH